MHYFCFLRAGEMEALRPVPKIFPLSKNTQCWLEKKGMPRSKKNLPGQWKKKTIL
jgi:hypothetical protein